MATIKINMALKIYLKSGEVIEIEGYDLMEKANNIKNENGWIIIDGYMFREKDISYIRTKRIGG